MTAQRESRDKDLWIIPVGMELKFKIIAVIQSKFL